MEPDATKLLEELLKLPVEARSALAGSLIDGLDEDFEPGPETAWEAEIARRLKELDASDVKTISWPEARRIIVGG